MTSKSRLVLSTLLLTIGLIAVWCLDMSITTLNLGGVLSNGFIFRDPTQMYHLSIGAIVLVLFCSALINISKEAEK
jgi:hypothetical protein